MDVAQKLFQNLTFTNSTVKTYRLENEKKTDEDEDDEDGNNLEEVETPASEKKLQNTSSDFKGRLKISLNNARYGLSSKGKATFNDKSPICLLGNFYSTKNANSTTSDNFNSFNSFKSKISKNNSSPIHNEDVIENNESLLPYEKFLGDYKSKIWFTYRKGFKILPGTKLDTDCGWGCMLRCGQMLVAQAFMCHALKDEALRQLSVESLRRKIVKDFLDCPESPLSLHKLIETSGKQGKQAGDWFGPASTAFIMKNACESASMGPTYQNFFCQNVAIYVATDCVVCTIELESLCTQGGGCGGSSPYKISSPVNPSRTGKSSEETKNFNVTTKKFVVDESRAWSKSLLLIIPLRLGTESANILYVDHLKSLLSLKSCVGIIGGKPKRSVYFVGWHDDNLIYLDPHYCQDVVNSNSSSFLLDSFACSDPRKMSFSSLDPSCAVGFYLRDKNELVHFLADVSEVAEFGCSSMKFPLFSVVHDRAELAPRKSSIGSYSEFDRSPSNSFSNVLKPRLNSVSSSKGYVLL